MASTNSPDLIVGSLVNFKSNTASREFFQGTVYFFNPVDASFGIDDVSRTKVRGAYNRVWGYYHFFLKDIKDLRVIRLPTPKPTKDDQKSNLLVPHHLPLPQHSDPVSLHIH